MAAAAAAAARHIFHQKAVKSTFARQGSKGEKGDRQITEGK